MNYLKNIEKGFPSLEKKKENHLTGIIEGYEVTFSFELYTKDGIVAYVNFYGDEDLKAEIIKAFISYNGATLAAGRPTKFGVRLTLNGVWTIQSAAKKMVLKINHVLSLLKEKLVPGAISCPLTGKTLENKSTILVHDAYVTLEEEDANKIREEYQEKEKEFENAPNNYLKGALGALIGAVVCGIVYYILYTLGYISIWVGVLAIFLASFLYDKFGGKPNKVKLLIISVISLVVIMVASFLSILDVTQAAMNEYNIQGSALDFILENQEMMDAFVYDMVMSFVFTIIGVIAQVVYVNKKQNSKRNIVK